MIEISFPQPCKPLTLNERLHWAEKARRTAEWRKAAGWAAIQRFSLDSKYHRSLPRSVVQLVVPVRSVRIRRDPMNWALTCKPCVDGLIDAGLWRDDTPEYLMTIEPDFKQGGDVVIKIWERGEWLAVML